MRIPPAERDQALVALRLRPLRRLPNLRSPAMRRDPALRSLFPLTMAVRRPNRARWASARLLSLLLRQKPTYLQPSLLLHLGLAQVRVRRPQLRLTMLRLSPVRLRSLPRSAAALLLRSPRAKAAPRDQKTFPSRPRSPIPRRGSSGCPARPRLVSFCVPRDASGCVLLDQLGPLHLCSLLRS